MVRRVEWFKWIIHWRSPRVRLQQLWLVFTFEVYYQLCKLRGYPVTHILEGWGEPVPDGAKSNEGRYILVWPRLPLSIRLLDKIFPFGREAHAEWIPYTPEAAEKIRKTGRRAQIIDIWCELRFAGSDD